MNRENEMNCDDYKKALTAEPGFEDETGHAESCASCSAYRAEVLALDEAIAAAMRVEVPEMSLPELPPVEAAEVVSLPERRSRSTRTWYALAATVVLAAFIGLRMTDSPISGGSLAEQVLAHIDHEPGALRVSDKPVSDRRLLRALPEDIATMNHDMGLITYAQSCRINGRVVPHLVIQGENGPVTILLMPDEEVAEAVTIDGVNIKGVILPVGNGSIAIVGDREEKLDDVQKYVRKSVTWST